MIFFAKLMVKTPSDHLFHDVFASLSRSAGAVPIRCAATAAKEGTDPVVDQRPSIATVLRGKSILREGWRSVDRSLSSYPTSLRGEQLSNQGSQSTILTEWADVDSVRNAYTKVSCGFSLQAVLFGSALMLWARCAAIGQGQMQASEQAVFVEWLAEEA